MGPWESTPPTLCSRLNVGHDLCSPRWASWLRLESLAAYGEVGDRAAQRNLKRSLKKPFSPTFVRAFLDAEALALRPGTAEDLRLLLEILRNTPHFAPMKYPVTDARWPENYTLYGRFNTLPLEGLRN